MKMKIFAIMLLLLVIYSVLSSCGGGSGTTHPVSLFTPTPNYSGTGNMAYITFTVDWPKNGKTGKLNTLSKNGKQITVSDINPDTKVIKIYIFNYNVYANMTPTPGADRLPWHNVLAWGVIQKDEKQTIVPVKLISTEPDPNVSGPPPAMCVLIWAESFDGYDVDGKVKHQIAHTNLDDPFAKKTLQVGYQSVTLKLHKKDEIDVTAEKSTPTNNRYIIAHDTGSSNQWDIKANLKLLYGTPSPLDTPVPDTSGQTSEPDPDQTIYFKVIEGSGTLDPNQAQTDPNGDCIVHFTQNGTGPAKIQASYQYDSTDANTTITAECKIGEGYNLTVVARDSTLNLSKQAKIGANSLPYWTPTPGRTDGQDRYQQPAQNDRNIIAHPWIQTPTPNPVSTDIIATLMLALPTPQPVANKLIKFTLKQGDDGSTTLSLLDNTGTTVSGTIVSGYTLNDGTSTATLSTTTAGDKVIEASFQVDPNDPNSRIYSAQCNVNVNGLPTPTATSPPPTVAPTPLPVPYYVPYVVGSWSSIYGKGSYTIQVTEPVFKQYWSPQLWMGLIITDENGVTYQGLVNGAYIEMLKDGNYIGGGIADDAHAYGYPNNHAIFWDNGDVCIQ